MPTKEEFNEFIKKSGLKKKFIAKMIGIPPWVITDWLNGKTVLFKMQQRKLTSFMDEYKSSNNYMKTEGEIEFEELF